MRKNKIYIGRNKGVDRYGRNRERKIPSILRKFFALQVQRQTAMFDLKVAMNSVIGAASRALEPAGYEKALKQRREILARFNSGGYHGGLV